MPEPAFAWTRSHCVFSPCRTWRYTLERWWARGPYVNFLCLNPSTADETKNDPTVTRCQNYARAWGYAGCLVTNLFALRSTDPAALLRHPDPIGADNDRHIRQVAQAAGMVLAAWGGWGKVHGRDDLVAQWLRTEGVRLQCLGVTKDGYPRHPLYLSKSAQPLPYGTGT
jgi:hypothetical protein